MTAENQSSKKIFGVIGDPVSHSLSPAMHNAAFEELGLDAEYKAFSVKADGLAEFFERIRSGEISGVNVTVPHKEAALRLCDETSADAARIGAANTITSKAGKVFGDNTDGRGYLKSLFESFSLNLPQMYVVVIGAGGASLAICDALCAAGVTSLTVANRDVERARNLVARLQMHFPAQTLQSVALANVGLVADDADLIVNATSLGLNGLGWPDLSFLDVAPPHCIVSDIVYRPRKTELLEAAEARGLKTHDGLGMLLHQGAIAFEIFTGRKAPTETMRGALERAL